VLVRLLFCLLIYDCTNGCVFSELLSSAGNAEQWKYEGVKMSCDHASSAVSHCCVYRDTNPGQEGGEQWRRNSLGKVDNV